MSASASSTAASAAAAAAARETSAGASYGAGARASAAPPLFIASLWLLAAYHLGLAIFMAAAPHTFYTSIGPFGVANSHYIRDTATFSAALGVGLVISIWRPSWRLPVLTVVTVQFALHTVNHLFDIDDAHPGWTGYFDFAALLATTLLLAWMLRSAATATRRTPSDPQGAPR
jgi:hypothetical protein